MSSAQVVSTADVTSLDDDCRVKEDVCQKSDSTEIVKEDSSVSESFYSDSSVDEEIKRKPLCDHFKRGKCRLENSCRFVHSLKEHNDPSLITKRRAEAKAQHKLLKLRNREAEKSDTQLTSAGDTDSISSCSPPPSPRYCSFSRDGVSPQLSPYGLHKRASTGSLPAVAVSYSNCYAPYPVYYSPVCYPLPCYFNTPGAYYVVQQSQWEASPCYSATTEIYDHPQQRDVVPPTTTGVRRSASCSMVQTPTFQGSRMYSEEHYEE